MSKLLKIINEFLESRKTHKVKLCGMHIDKVEEIVNSLHGSFKNDSYMTFGQETEYGETSQKLCFGNISSAECNKNGGHHNCELNRDGKCLRRSCFAGPCDCRYKKQCFITRQTLQEEFRKQSVYDGVEECDFFKMIKEKENKLNEKVGEYES